MEQGTALDVNDEQLLIFETEIGWTGILARGLSVARLTFGHKTAVDVVGALDTNARIAECASRWLKALQTMVEVYAKGRRVPFGDIAIDLGDLTPFRKEVLQACRTIPYGETRTYKELAEQVGRPNSVRSIGTCMAANPIPIIVPCHRVLASDGSLGGYSAPGGTEMKSLLLQMERETVAAVAK